MELEKRCWCCPCLIDDTIYMLVWVGALELLRGCAPKSCKWLLLEWLSIFGGTGREQAGNSENVRNGGSATIQHFFVLDLLMELEKRCWCCPCLIDDTMYRLVWAGALELLRGCAPKSCKWLLLVFANGTQLACSQTRVEFLLFHSMAGRWQSSEIIWIVVIQAMVPGRI